jgi:hypothetical protein
MLPQEVWKHRREAGIHGRVPTRKEWDGHRKVLIGTMNCSRKVLNQKESWVIDFEMDVVESLKERHYWNASLEEIQQSKTRKRCTLSAVDGEVRKKEVAIWDESKIVAV